MKWSQWFTGFATKPTPPGNTDNSPADGPVNTGSLPDIPVNLHLVDNLRYLQTVLGEQDDIIYRDIRLGSSKNNSACIIYIEGLVDKATLNDDIIKSLMLFSKQDDLKISRTGIREFILETALTASNVVESSSLKQIVASILSGGVILLIDGLSIALMVNIRSHVERAISEPPSEVMVRGPREGFTETVQTNITMIRRRIKHPHLRIEKISIGRFTATDVSLVYIKGISSPELVEEVKQRLLRIDIDGVLDSGYLEELIEDDPFSPFPQIQHTERPDRVVGSLLEGKVALLTDGSPFALILPVPLPSFINSPEDYYERYILTTALRWVRWISFFVSLFLPSLYIAVTTFHQEMIPSRLLISISAYRQGLPFSTLIEALLMEFVFEILREAGVRLPRAIGQAVSIAGALVIGQSAVTAGIISPLMVIIVATTGIASFTIPSYNLGITIRLLRFPLMVLAGTFGLFGVSIGLIMIIIHTSKLRSFGLPYLSPLSPLHPSSLKDILIRAPWWAMDKRPAEMEVLNTNCQTPGLKPSPPKGRNKYGGGSA